VWGGGGEMADGFFNNPILNSPYEAPTRHHALDKDGQPLDQPPVHGRRPSSFITPVPKPRKKRQKASEDQTNSSAWIGS
jgi:type III restriction enzyme